ncbi:MAG: hypothetical protein A2Z20_01050 [Bdellovibrionales bacterium RBG_16_40_8]|nr:MAG: hypothetical protein A2Z20_01050 [Bdellovibrionales bacterium RBG_16_40_8]
MAAVMNIISALGINATLWFQLGIFIMVYAFLRLLVFGPYFRAYSTRQGQTQGSRKRAEKVIAQTKELQTIYQRKARELNSEIKAIYEKARFEATKEQEKLNAESRENAKKNLEGSRKKILEQYNSTREELIKYAPELSHKMADRLLPGEVQ